MKTLKSYFLWKPSSASVETDTHKMKIPVDLQPQVLLVHPAALAKHLQIIFMSDPS